MAHPVYSMSHFVACACVASIFAVSMTCLGQCWRVGQKVKMPRALPGCLLTFSNRAGPEWIPKEGQLRAWYHPWQVIKAKCWSYHNCCNCCSHELPPTLVSWFISSNGHMMTHRTKKPFECSFEGCTKSYCDARSLKRHLENHHGVPQDSLLDVNQPAYSLNGVYEIMYCCPTRVGG